MLFKTTHEHVHKTKFAFIYNFLFYEDKLLSFKQLEGERLSLDEDCCVVKLQRQLDNHL